MAIDLTDNSYADTISNAEGTSVVQFTAPWCGPCRMLTPRLQGLEDAGHFTYYKVDVDENSQLARDFRIMSVPTVFVYKNGNRVNQWVGAKSEADILAKLDEV